MGTSSPHNLSPHDLSLRSEPAPRPGTTGATVVRSPVAPVVPRDVSDAFAARGATRGARRQEREGAELRRQLQQAERGKGRSRGTRRFGRAFRFGAHHSAGALQPFRWPVRCFCSCPGGSSVIMPSSCPILAVFGMFWTEKDASQLFRLVRGVEGH